MLRRAPRSEPTALETAVRNLRLFHSAQLVHADPVDVAPGVRAWREFRPMDRVGVYAPGGRAAYPSSVLMAVVPARVAGVLAQIVVMDLIFSLDSVITAVGMVDELAIMIAAVVGAVGAWRIARQVPATKAEPVVG